MTRRALLLSYAFPPVQAPESFLSAKTMGSVPGWEVDVLHAAPEPAGFARDDSLAAYTRERFASIEAVAPSGLLSAAYRTPALWKWCPWAGHLPDRWVFMNQVLQRRAEDWIRRRGYAVIITWSQFHSVHLVGVRLTRARPALKWVVHLSDPWADNPFMRYNVLTRAINRRLETRVLGLADRLVFTSGYTVDLVLRKHPPEWRRKVHVVPHPFDPALYGGADDVVPDTGARPWLFRYVGAFYGARTPNPLCRALRLVHQRDPEFLARIRVEFIGTLQHDLAGNADARALPAGLLRTRPSVDYLTSLRLMSGADVLLVIDAPSDRSVFLPSKLVDYIGARRPIFGITPPGTSRDLIEALGFPTANPDSPDEIAEALRALVHDLERGRTPPVRADSDVAARYTTRAVRADMAALLDAVVR